jgi:hypothetical protein
MVASDLGDGMMPRVEVDRFDPGGDVRKYEEKVTLRLLPMSPHSLGLTARSGGRLRTGAGSRISARSRVSDQTWATPATLEILAKVQRAS